MFAGKLADKAATMAAVLVRWADRASSNDPPGINMYGFAQCDCTSSVVYLAEKLSLSENKTNEYFLAEIREILRTT